ncbi:MAG: hypothetical protein AABX10_01485 [Nanoarchaeota archaeon]
MTNIQRMKSDMSTADKREATDKEVKDNRDANDALTKERRSKADEKIEENRIKNDELTADRREEKDEKISTALAMSLLIGLAAGIVFMLV